MKISLAIINILLAFNLSFLFDSKDFSGNPETYTDELYEYLSGISEEHEYVLNDFLKAWEEDSVFNEQEQTNIIELSRALTKTKIRPVPHFTDFLKCMMAFKEKEVSEMNYNEWVLGLAEMLDNRKTKVSAIQSVLKHTHWLVSDNILYESRSVKWKTTAPAYYISSYGGITFDFVESDLICYAKDDSMKLFKTMGTLYPITHKWEGCNGLVSWERAGFDLQMVYAGVGDYTIDVTRTEYKMEQVSFTNKNYFEEPLLGRIHHKATKIEIPEDASYPRFESYTSSYYIENLYEDINYRGGLAMHGIKLVGTGNSLAPAKLYLYRLDTLRLEATSNYFGFRPKKVVSGRTSISMRLRQDSIFHPDLVFNYRVDDRSIVLLKSDNFSSQSPYYNSYHALDMNFEQLSWKMDDDNIYFSAARGATIGNAYFESVNFFNFESYMNMQLMDYEHPLLSIRNFARAYKSEEFTVSAYADFLNMPLSTVRQQAMRLAVQGFVFYDYNQDLISIKPRLHDYISASINRIDYDVIGFPSRVQAPMENAIFDLQSFDLTINGIPQVHISDSQNVRIIPRNKQIILKKNRDFEFDGTVEAGLLTFKGEDFYFDYDSFKIDLNNIDSIRLRYHKGDRDNYGLLIETEVTNLIEHVTGEILIDKEDNKSARKSYPRYPIFVSKENSYVFYSNSFIEEGAYPSDDFYVELEPFEMDSLDNFNYKSLALKGNFVSADIFPEFQKSLSIQADNSLGFQHDIPPQGFPMYGGKGDYFSKISLTNKGLRGDGYLEYITSTTWSEDFIFYPDSMMTLANKYNIKAQIAPVEFPVVNSINNDVLWHPYADVMYVDTTDTRFQMYNDSTYLSGALALRPDSLTGSGLVDMSAADLRAKHFLYKSNEFTSDTSDFRLRSLSATDFTVLTDNVDSRVSFSRQKGWFKSNEEFTLVDFPENKYVSYLDYFIWDMPKSMLAMGSPGAEATVDMTNEDEEPYGPRYISLDRNQDSLNFVSPLAYYDYKHNIIDAKGVKFIDVADARIYPKDGEVSIELNANMRKFFDSRVKANRFSQFHNIHSAKIKILGRFDYTASGDYDYIDENEDVQLIHFHDVHVNDSMETEAIAEISDSLNFMLSPVYAYKGKAYLTADREFLRFSGGTKIEHNCDKLTTDWLRFDTEINPNDIYIPYPEKPENYEFQKIFSGNFLYYDSVHIYPNFLNYRKNYSDNPLVTTHGYLYYNKAQNLYKLGSKEKINDFTLPEPYMSLHREECILYGEGPINLGQNLGQLKLNCYGSYRYNLDKHETSLNLIMGINFFIHQPSINYMARTIDSLPNLKAVDIRKPALEKQMKNMLGEKEYVAMMDELSLFGEVKNLPDPMKQTIILNELSLVWNDRTNSYQSKGKIGIASIDGVIINKRVDGFVELQIKRSGDIFDIYLELSQTGDYLYFGYTRGVMQTLTNNRTYLDNILALKKKETRMKVPRGETSYLYLISTNRKRDNFYKKWKSTLSDEEKQQPAQLNTVPEQTPATQELPIEEAGEEDVKTPSQENQPVPVEEEEEVPIDYSEEDD